MENEHQWKYRELPPFALFEALKLCFMLMNVRSREPHGSGFDDRSRCLQKALLGSLIWASAAPFLLFVPKVGLPLFLTWGLGILIAAIANEVRLIRWRC